MDLLQQVLSGDNPLKAASCFWLCMFFTILCDCKPQQGSSNDADVLEEQARHMKSYMDDLKNPCDDFYQFACGKWDSVHKIPDDKDQFGTLLLTEAQAMDDIAKLLKDPDMPSNISEAEKDAIKKAKRFYASCTNTANIEKLGTDPLKKLLDELGGWPALQSSLKSDHDWLKVLVETRKLGEQLLFFSEVSQDLYKSSRTTLYAYHPLLGLQNRHYFEEKDGKKTKELKAYEELIAGILKRLDVDDDRIKTEVQNIVKFETDIAAISLDSNEITNLAATYNPAILKDLIDNYTEIDWLKYFKTLHNKPVGSSEPIIAAKDYLKKLNVLVRDTKSKTIVNYLLWRIVLKLAPFVGTSFEREIEAFNKDTVGITKPPPREQECTKYAIQYMGSAVGVLYIQKHFNKEAKQDAENLLNRLKKNFRHLTENNKWLDPETKSAALEKLDKMGIKIGYPDRILKPSYLEELYKDVSIKDDDFFSNIIALIRVKNSQESKKIGQPVEKDQWEFNFLSANAQYPYPYQAIFIAAFMFRPPLYHKDFPKFLNYGLLGATTAHEMSHAFDSTGITFDKNGDMKSWFSNSSLEKYNERTKCFVDKYGKLSRDGVPLNGETILNEAIADDVGLKIAFIAYNQWIEENKNSLALDKEVLPGFNLSKEKLFFLSFAQIHCNSIRQDAWPSLWKIDNHALANYRVNTVLSNSQYFVDTFKCSSDSPMNSKEKCVIW